MRERNPELEVHPLLHERGNLDQELQNAPHKYPYGQRGSRILEVVPDDSHREEDRGNVQDNGRSSGQSKNMKAIEDSHRQGGQSDEEQIGENNAVQVHALVALFSPICSSSLWPP